MAVAVMRSGDMRLGLLNLIQRVRRDGELAVMVEVGSYAGHSAEIFAQSGAFAKVYCVDPWAPDFFLVREGKKHPAKEAESAFDEMAAANPTIIKVKERSADATAHFPDQSVEFVYIDADHRYEAVRADILAWKSKVRPGWFIGGHDFSLRFDGVIRAVTEAFKQPITVFRDTSWLVKL